MLCVQWGEIGVEEALLKSGVSFDVIDYQSGMWSLSRLLQHSKGVLPDSHLIWSTVDIEFSSNLLEKWEPFLDSGSVTSSFPHIFGEGEAPLELKTGIDIIGIPAHLRTPISFYAEKYPNEGWGLFENQLVKYAEQCGASSLENVLDPPVAKQINPSDISINRRHSQLQQVSANIDRWQPWLSESKANYLWLSVEFVMLRFRGTSSAFRRFLTLRFLIRLLRYFPKVLRAMFGKSIQPTNLR